MPASTPHQGFPYPLPTEPVAEGAQAIRNLAEKLDAQYQVVHYVASVQTTLQTDVETFLPLGIAKIDVPGGSWAADNPSRIVAKAAGVYAAHGSGYVDPNPTGFRQMSLWKNQTVQFGSSGGLLPTSFNGDYGILEAFGIVQCAANDYIEFTALQNAGGPLNFTYDGAFQGLRVWRIG